MCWHTHTQHHNYQMNFDRIWFSSDLNKYFSGKGLPWPSISTAYVSLCVVAYLTWWVIHLSDTLIMIGFFKWMKPYFVMSFAHQSTIKLQGKEQLHEQTDHLIAISVWQSFAYCQYRQGLGGRGEWEKNVATAILHVNSLFFSILLPNNVRNVDPQIHHVGANRC